MSIKNLTDEDIELLNTKVGLRALFRSKKININKALEETKYTFELKQKQEELIKLQNWVIKNNKKIVILFEGRDVAGKGGAIRRITQHLNPRNFRIAALSKPTSDERQQWFFQRYINKLPKPGEIVFFDRSWYNRAVLEPVNNFCTQNEYETFMKHVNGFEQMLIESDTYLIKFYFSITKEEQAKRFKDIESNPLKRWKMSPLDKKAQKLWDEYTLYKNKMFEVTNTELAPWQIIDANKKSSARLNAIDYMLEAIPYEEIPVEIPEIINSKS